MPAGQQGFRPARADCAQAGLVAAALFALYAASSPRTVALEDDSLFVLSSYFLGIEHPPGYPLFTLIGHLFAQLPFGSVAYRVHLASALFGALSGAAAWLCARSLVAGRVPAYLAAFALGASPVFWSQSIIAEVYTLNTFFFLVLAYLGLRACPPSGEWPSAPEQRRLLALMALLFGLSLSNHWPLMVLAAPAFLVLLWPARREMLGRFGAFAGLVILGLLPYVWMVRRSWQALPISFDGPLETLSEIWFFISRAGYANVDDSAAADWMDRVRFFRFLFEQLLVQFALAGTLLAAAGFVAQWRALGNRVAAFLTIGFLMPTAVLLILLNFDYSSATRHVFHVYPLPAYAVVALWIGLGLAWLAERYALRPAHAVAAGAATLALIFAAGAWVNLRTDNEWAARYVQTILKTLPANAVVFGQGEADLGPMAYFHMVENQRPDITLYQARGLVLGNRLFHPLRTGAQTQQRLVREMIERQTDPVAFTLDAYTGYAQRDRWLYIEVDKSSTDASKVSVDIPEEAVRFFEESVARGGEPNAWIANFQAELRRRYATLLARSLARDRPPVERERSHLELLAGDFYGALGIAEGLRLNKVGYSVGAIAEALDKARKLMPSDVRKSHQSRFFYLRGVVRADLQDLPGAIEDLETAISLWPVRENAATQTLEDLYRRNGDAAALDRLRARTERLKRARP